MRSYVTMIIVLAARPAFADIVQPAISLGFSTSVSPFGQSFTATSNESLLQTVGFMWGTPFQVESPDPTINLELRSGVGFSGPILASDTIAEIPDSNPVQELD
jgi:hypothetical protein